jgi:hypothetical protein
MFRDRYCDSSLHVSLFSHVQAAAMSKSAVLSSIRVRVTLHNKVPQMFTALKQGLGSQMAEKHQALAESQPDADESGTNSVTSAWNRFQAAVKFPAVKARRGPPATETGSDVLQAALADLVTGNETRAQEDLTHAPKHAFLGPTGEEFSLLGSRDNQE